MLNLVTQLSFWFFIIWQLLGLVIVVATQRIPEWWPVPAIVIALVGIAAGVIEEMRRNRR